MSIPRVAIIGAGMCGLSIAWHLIESGRCSVTLFDPSGIAEGASGIAAGLMHPYPGEEGKRSFLASEGIAATRRLLEVAQRHSDLPLFNEKGILRFSQNEQMDALFSEHAKIYADVEASHGGFLIRSGMTIFCRRYLQALWLAIQEGGGMLVQKAVTTLDELGSFDHVIIAAGAGVLDFIQTRSLRLQLLKGQILKCQIPEEIAFPEQSLIGKGYIAHAEEKGSVYIGSTYERGQLSVLPDREKALSELIPKAQKLHPQAAAFTITECAAAFRVMRIGHYYPMVGRLFENAWVCTALGSRGLLYHGLIGQCMKEAVLNNDEACIPKEFAVLKNRDVN